MLAEVTGIEVKSEKVIVPKKLRNLKRKDQAM